MPRDIDAPSPIGATDFSPELYARIGVVYLLIIAAGLFAEVLVRDRLIVESDAAATAHNIAAHSFMFRLGVVADLTTYLCAVARNKVLCRDTTFS